MKESTCDYRARRWMDRLRDARLPALAGWQKGYGQTFEVLNDVTHRIFSEFQNDGAPARPEFESWYAAMARGSGMAPSIMPFSSVANPVRTLAALALRLSRHFG